MPRRFTRLLACMCSTAAAVTALALAPVTAQAAPRAQSAPQGAYALPSGVTDPCPATAGGSAGCAALTAAPSGDHATAVPAAGTTPAGYTPANLTSAYQLPTGMGSGSTVAVVTAYDDPDAASDLAVYRSEYGLPACTAGNGCFDKVSQTGGTSYPKTSAGWSAGTAESMDMISALCPNCHILLVEATNSAISNLGTAENEAVTLGAQFIDNDWTIPEAEVGSAETTYDTEYFDHPGVAITAPAGNSGYGVSYPAASPYVTAVGGTTLTQDTGVGRGWDETAWSGTGSGCSAYEPKPPWQADSGCTMRTVNDAAAVADPSTPVAYYDTPTADGWGSGSGTAISAAIVAAAYALAGSPAPGSDPVSYMYSHPGAFRAITAGSNGTCSVTYLCTAGTGYNGPAGNGTPYAGTAFSTTGAKPVSVTATGGTTWAFALSTSGDIEASSLPSGGSTWSALTSLGGTWSGYPSALAAADGSVSVFALDAGNLYYDRLPSGSTTWSGWTELGNPGDSLTGTPITVQDPSGNIDVFGRDAVSGILYETQLSATSGTWSAFTSLGGAFPADVSAAVGSGGWTIVMGIGNNSTLYEDSLAPDGSWSGWTAVSGSTVTGTPAFIQDAAGTYHVFARQSSNGALLTDTEASGSSTWNSWTSIGGTWLTNSVALGASGGTVWVFAIGTVPDIYKDTLPTSGSWSGWGAVGTGFTGVPSFNEDTNGDFHLTGRSQAGSLEANQINGGSSTWLGWSTLGGSLAGS
jgi:hypothetical protein